MSEAILRCTNHPEISDGCQPCSRCGRWFCESCRVEVQGQLLCADCKTEHLRDLQAGVPTAAVLDLASVWRRFGAVFLDGMLFSLPLIAVMIVLGTATAFQEAEAPEDLTTLEGIFMVVYFASIVLATVGKVIYEGLMLQSRGQTLGKIAMSIKVVTPEGNDLSSGQAWSRAVLRFALDSCLSFINYLPALFSRDKTCIHDIAAKTRVINWRG